MKQAEFTFRVKVLIDLATGEDQGSPEAEKRAAVKAAALLKTAEPGTYKESVVNTRAMTDEEQARFDRMMKASAPVTEEPVLPTGGMEKEDYDDEADDWEEDDDDDMDEW